MTNHIIGVGNALVDSLVRIADDTLLRQLGLPIGSMQLIDEARYRLIQETTQSMHPQRATGGSACNTMLALAHLGHRPGFVGKIGSDDDGYFFETTCRQAGMAPQLGRSALPTGAASTFILPNGQRTFGTYLGAAADLLPSDLTDNMLDGATYLYIEGYLVQNHALMLRLYDMAAIRGVRVCLDLASYNIVEANRDFFGQLLPRTYMVFANEDEARACTGLKPQEAVAALARECTVAVVKVGARGAWVQQGEEQLHAPACPVAQVVDTTAAGDFFAAGFLHAYLHHAELSACAAAGSAVAGQVIQHMGTDLPTTAWQQLNSQLQALGC